MSIQVGVSEMFALLPHDHTSVGEGGKLNKYNDVFNNPDLIMNVLSDHDKVKHDALNIDADTVDGIDFPSAIAAVLTDHNKANHDTLGLDHAQLSNILSGQHHVQLHAAAHKVAGGDAIKIDELAVPDDNTLLNVLTTKHGLCPKLPDDAAKFLNGVGTWVAGGGAGTDYKVISHTRDLSAASGDVNYAGCPFTPKALIAIGSIAGTVQAIINVGFSDGTTHRALITYGDSGVTVIITNNIFYPRLTGSNYQLAVVKTLNADGCTLTWTKAGSPTGSFDFALIYLK